MLLAGGSFLLALLMNLILWPGMAAELASVQATWADLLEPSHPSFWENYWRNLRSQVAPWRTMFLAGSSNGLIFLIPLGLVARYWYLVTKSGAAPLPFLLWPAVTPVLVGLALLPLVLRGSVRSFTTLSRAGLTNPAVSAGGLGLATGTLLLGAAASATCLAVMLWSRSRSGQRS